jgi:hypothetical protein
MFFRTLIKVRKSDGSGAGANPVGVSHDLGLLKLPGRVIPTGIRAYRTPRLSQLKLWGLGGYSLGSEHIGL